MRRLCGAVFVQNIVAPEQAMNVLRIRTALAQVASATTLLDAAGGTLGLALPTPDSVAVEGLAAKDEPPTGAAAADHAADPGEAVASAQSSTARSDGTTAGAGAGAREAGGTPTDGVGCQCPTTTDGVGCQCPALAAQADARCVTVPARRVQEVTVTVPPLCSHCLSRSASAGSDSTGRGDTSAAARAPVVLEFEALSVVRPPIAALRTVWPPCQCAVAENTHPTFVTTRCAHMHRATTLGCKCGSTPVAGLRQGQTLPHLSGTISRCDVAQRTCWCAALSPCSPSRRCCTPEVPALPVQHRRVVTRTLQALEECWQPSTTLQCVMHARL